MKKLREMQTKKHEFKTNYKKCSGKQAVKIPLILQPKNKQVKSKQATQIVFQEMQ